jgi:peptidoglycan hydrolase-like protein with peptidoglycan-binding domain
MIRKLVLLLAALVVFASASFAQAPAASPAANSASDTAAKKPPVFRPTKDQITQVQKMLKDKKLYTGEASGSYNDDTRAGIKTFQKGNGLTETGTLNRATLEKFGVTLTDEQKAIPVNPNSIASTSNGTAASTSGASASSTSSGPKRPAPFRANADQIKGAQKILRDGKMLTGGEDGKLDDATRAGLEKYQEANKLNVTGTLNAATLEKMGIALTDAQKKNVAAQAAYDAAKAKTN